MSHFRVGEREVDQGCREIRVEGELDLAVAGQLEDAIAGCGDKHTLIDLGECEFIDSTGIAVIVRAYRERAADGRGRIAVHSASDQVLRVLTITGLTEVGLVFESRDAALAEFAATV
jgi:anti-anti-sigma factor